MKATDMLMEEHRVIERVLTSLEIAAARLQADQPVRTGFFDDAADFIKGFADGCHHLKEEQVLFRALVDHGVSQEGGPVGVMLAEHQEGRDLTAAMRLATRQLQAGDPTARRDLATAARRYAALLRAHIAKEDEVLFPLADRVIPPAEQDRVFERFEQVEHEETGAGVHERYLALADALQREIGGHVRAA